MKKRINPLDNYKKLYNEKLNHYLDKYQFSNENDFIESELIIYNRNLKSLPTRSPSDKELKFLRNNPKYTFSDIIENRKILFKRIIEFLIEKNNSDKNPKPQENYNSKSKSVSYHNEKEKHSHIFKGEAFKIWEYMYYEFDVTDSSRSDVKFIFTNMKKDNHIHQTVGQKSFLDWISETYQKEIGKTSADVESKYRRNVYRDALETIKN